MPEQRIEPVVAAQPAASDDDRARADAAEAAAVAAHPNRGQFVLYMGPRNVAAAAEELKKRAPKLGEGTFAQITATQWNQAGVPSDRSHTWNLANNWRIPATQFSQAQIDYLLTNSRRFELVDADSSKVDQK